MARVVCQVSGLFLVVFAQAAALAQTVNMPQTVEVPRGRLFSLTVTYDGDDFRYIPAAELDVFREYTEDRKEVKLRGVAYEDGLFRIVAIAVAVGTDGKAKLSDFQSCIVKVGAGVPPPPVVTVPPQPDPTPGPPTTPPVVTPVGGLRVLTIYESDKPMPRSVYDAMFDPTVKAYLDAKCLKGPDGRTPEHRRFDEDPPLTNMSPSWQALRAALPATLPLYPEPNPSEYQVPHFAVGDSSGAVVASGPVPGNAAKYLEQLKKYGGP